ncbi:hypothetical protein V5T82_09305 [Magnetovibrio sp. PR-2]|uniref:hypothetical protein n=1 Tax=Magnetovibrio sp. PR-2 TaxID=3120356 RepID=UPI002FCDEDB3
MFEKQVFLQLSLGYLVYTPPYVLICAAGVGRARNGFLISIFPAFLTAYWGLSQRIPELKVLEEGMAGFWIFFLGTAATASALHLQWRNKWPVFSPFSNETPYSLLTIFSAMPMLGILVSYPFAISLTIYTLWKKRQSSSKPRRSPSDP